MSGKAFHALGRIRNVWRQARFLDGYRTGLPQALAFVVCSKVMPGTSLCGRYASHPFRFRRCDVSAIREVLEDREYAFLNADLKDLHAPVVVDVGAHIGLFALWILEANPGAQILSVEASPSTFRMLEENTRQNAPASWRAIHRAAWRDGEAIGFADDGEAMSRRVCAQGGVRVEGISLLSLIESFPRVDLMKIDIEGAEEVFLCGDPRAGQALDRVRTLVIELHPGRCDVGAVRDLLAKKFPNIEEVPGRRSSKPLLYCRA